MSVKSPAFQFYPTDYLGSQRVQMMTLEEEGAYIRLLSSCWQHGSVPSDPEQAARLIGKGASTTLATTVLAMFILHPAEPGRMVHDRLEEERQKQADWREKSSAGGRKSAAARQRKRDSKGGSRVVEPPYQPKGNTPSPSPSSVSVSVTDSDSIGAADKPPKPRNPLIDALAIAEGIPLDQISTPVGARLGKSLAIIRQTSFDVTVSEIERRTANLRLHHEGANCTAMALANHWGKCHEPPTTTTAKRIPGPTWR